MKKIIFIIMLTAIAVFASCSKESQPNRAAKTEIRKSDSNNSNAEEDGKEAENENAKEKENAKDKNEKDEQGQDNKKRLSDYYMASRAYTRWKKDVDINEIDFDRLVRLKDASFVTAEYMSKWLDIYSSDVEATYMYKFTEQDIAKTELIDVKFERSNYSSDISFKIRYNGITSDKKISCPFNLNDYYKETAIKVDNSAAKNMFLYGTYLNASEFISDFVKYDSDKFIVEYGGYKNINQISGTLEIGLLLKDHYENELAHFQIKVDDFKPVSELAQQLLIAPTSAGMDFFSNNKRLKKAPDGDVTKLLESGFSNFMLTNAENAPKVQIYYKDESGKYYQMYIEQRSMNNSIIKYMVPESRRVRDLHLTFYNPIFKLSKAMKNGNKLTLTYKLEFINDVNVEGAEFTMNDLYL